MADSLVLVMLAVSAVAPSLLLLWYFHARDVYREPPRVLWTTFGLGVAIIVPVGLVAWPLDRLAGTLGNPFALGFATAFLVAAIPEELCKLLVLTRYSMRHAAFDEPMDGVVYGVAASLGFATFENVLYIADGGLPVALLRALTAVPGHAFLGAIMGHFVARARFDPDPEKRRRWLWRAFVIPTLLHGAYDFPILSAPEIDEAVTWQVLVAFVLIFTVPAILVFEGVWSVRLVRRQRSAQLAGRAAAAEPPPAEPPPARAAEPTAGRRGRLGGWILTVGGGLVASAGGLVTLGVLVGWMVGAAEAEEAGDLVVGTVVLGVLPLAVGAGLFAWGVRRLNRTQNTEPRHTEPRR